MINQGIINVGGGAGGGGAGATSGIYTINSQTGPAISLISSDSSLNISSLSNVIDFSCSGFVSGINVSLQELIAASSGLVSINNELGPHITHQSSDGSVDITVPSANTINHSVSGFVSGVQAFLLDEMSSLTSAHNDLTGLQGGQSGQYYHLTSGEYYTQFGLPTSGQILLQLIAQSSGIVSINNERGPDITIASADGSIGVVTTANNIDLSGSGYFVPKADCDWNGFPNRNDSTISFNHATRAFTISPTGVTFDYYMDCNKYTSAGDSLTISADEGVHYIYYDGNTLTESVNPSLGQVSLIIRTKVLVSAVYWGTVQSSGLYVGEERHGISMSPVTHNYLHFQEGLRYTSGLGLNNITADGDGDLDTSAIFGIDAGSVSDEDIYHAISAVGSGVGLPIYYLTGTTPNWNRWTNAPFSIRTYDGTSSTRLAYNQYTGGAWQLTEVTNGNFVLCHVFATTEIDYPMIAIMGQNEYANITQARAGADTEIFSLVTNDLLLPETRPIATFIFQTSNLYDNGVKGRIRATDDGEDYVDWRSETISRFSVSTSDHNGLTNLQGGTAGQYYHMTAAENAGLVTRYYAHFDGMTSGTFVHGLNSNYINYNVYSSGTLVEEIIPDRCFIDDENNITLLFNQPQTGFVALVG